ncbi:hypothetical protein KY331_00295 [Candidatus Woesearchaeota archaeon]|nr:hypothetical protein [Candidatus Woesearchaeota archaeon]
MKYNQKLFNNLVKKYEVELIKKLKNVKDKLFLVTLELENKKAFFSIAPLSMAVHNLEGDMHVVVKDKKSKTLAILKEVWNTYEDKKSRLKTPKVKALAAWINSVNKRTKTKVFKNIFQGPEIMLKAGKNGFSGTFNLKYHYSWHRYYKWKEVQQTAKTILTQGYGLKKDEKFGLGFVLVPSRKDLGLPLEDYLDSFSISYAFATIAKKLKTKVSMNAYSTRSSILANSIRSADLLSTLIGCELDKDVNEEVFQKFKVVSKLLKINRIELSDAAFGVHGKGYAGKFFFGEHIGYPTLDRKTRWSSPGQMLLKDRYETQTKYEKRDPKMRYGITETLPIDIFIETCNVNYDKIRARSLRIKKLLDKCQKIRVIGKEINGYKTDLEVGLLTKEGVRREFIANDSDLRSNIDKEYFEKTGIKAGCYANFPSGETFVTPENVKGLFIGDVVISVDRSIMIPENNPLIISVKKNKYKIVDGPKKLVAKMQKQLSDSRQKIRNIEANKSLPISITKMYRQNFNAIGEFAINLNPKAKLCDYLIVNEKIARMIHIALGMGFEPDRKTVYHWDIVINSPKQKLDIYGVDKKKKVHWIIKKGNFVV